MTLMEALSEGLAVTAIGLTITFGVLLLLMVVLMLMKTFFYKEEGKNSPPSSGTVETVKTVETVQNRDIDDTELVAVLTAAIAASLNTSTYNLKIKSFRRIKDSAPAWNRAGLNDVINSRY